MGRLSRVAALAGVAALVATPGCGGGGGGSGGDRTQTQARPDATTTMPSASRKRESPAQTVAPSHCPAGHPSCRSTEGRIVYVERVDPDGDGDAHFVVVDPQSITLPRLTAIDVRKGLRPHPLPGPGDLISAAGPVQTGSYGQHQIHALELHVAGR
jgi:hypothetical protein